MLFWRLTPEEAIIIRANKIDVAVDLYYSFLATDFDRAYETVGGFIKQCVSETLGDTFKNFLTLGTLAE